MFFFESYLELCLDCALNFQYVNITIYSIDYNEFILRSIFFFIHVFYDTFIIDFTNLVISNNIWENGGIKKGKTASNV